MDSKTTIVHFWIQCLLDRAVQPTAEPEAIDLRPPSRNVAGQCFDLAADQTFESPCTRQDKKRFPLDRLVVRVAHKRFPNDGLDGLDGPFEHGGKSRRTENVSTFSQEAVRPSFDSKDDFLSCS